MRCESSLMQVLECSSKYFYGSIPDCAKQLICELSESFPVSVSRTTQTCFWTVVVGSWVLTWVPQRPGLRNYSVVDRVWPLLPLVFAGISVREAVGCGCLGSKGLVAFLLIAIWSARLTYNSVRRGDYAWGAEDYRWRYVQSAIFRHVPTRLGGLVAWEALNIVFVSLIQVVILYLIQLPIELLRGPDAGWSLSEALFVMLMAVALVVEAVADRQQFEFRQLKHKYNSHEERRVPSDKRGEIQAGFVHSGLWAYSRHPNCFAEQLFWVALFGFAVAARGVDLSRSDNWWFGAGALSLCILFQCSTALTESISASKYPLYRVYQLKTNMFVPWIPTSNTKLISTAHKQQ